MYLLHCAALNRNIHLEIIILLIGSSSGFTASLVGSGFTADELKAINGYMTGVAGNAGDLNSQNSNDIYRASLRVAALSARLLDSFAPPLGTAISSILLIGALFSPFPNEEGQSLQDVLRDALDDAFDAFSDQQLRDWIANEEGNLETFQRNVEHYSQNPSDESLRADQNIYLLFNNNVQDTSFTFLGTFGRNYIRGQFENQSNPERQVNRIISWIQLARGRAILCHQIADVFARISVSNDPNDPINRRVVFWRDGEPDRLKRLAEEVLGDLLSPPSRVSSGISNVLSAWYRQSNEQRLDLEAFLLDEFGMRIPGTPLRIRNLAHNNHYMVVSEAACPVQARHGLGWTRGFSSDSVCPYVETTPGFTGWDKVFVVYGNRHSFTLWNVGAR